jgi:hypothetical protein
VSSSSTSLNLLMVDNDVIRRTIWTLGSLFVVTDFTDRAVVRRGALL